MNKLTSILAALAVLFTTTTVSAQEGIPSQVEILAAREACAKLEFPSDVSAQHLLREQCKIRKDLQVLAIIVATDTTRRDELDKMAADFKGVQARLRLAMTRIKAAEEAVKRTATAAPAQRSIVATQPTVAVAPLLVGAPPATYRVVRAPGQYAAATFDNPSWDSRLWITGLRHGTREASARGETQRYMPAKARIVLIKNGQPLAIAMPGGQTAGQIYADFDGDGQPDARPYYAVSPAVVNDLYLHALPHDIIEIVWLIPSGMYVQTRSTQRVLWTVMNRGTFRLRSQPGRWTIHSGYALQ